MKFTLGECYIKMCYIKCFDIYIDASFIGLPAFDMNVWFTTLMLLKIMFLIITITILCHQSWL